MLGQDVMAALRARRETVMGLGRRELDVTDEAAVRRVIGDYRPGVVLNCAAWTAVAAAQAHEDAALRVGANAQAVKQRVLAARRELRAMLAG